MATVDEQITEPFDYSRQFEKNKNEQQGVWLPVPIPVSNPTIGSGLQAALLYLHPKDNAESDVPNSTSGLVGMYTNSDSSLIGGFHDGNWNSDLYRYQVLAGAGEFNLDYFGIGSDSPLADNPIEYSLKSNILFTQLLRQLPGTKDWYLGFRYMYIDSNVEFFIFDPNDVLPPITDDMTNSSLGIMATFDSRDDNYYPTSGVNFEISWMRDDESIGSDFNFDKVDTHYDTYMSVSKSSIIALSAVFAKATGDVPFYLLPSLKMRGFANGLYKDDVSLSGHGEWRYKFKPRWGTILFYEIGSTAATTNDLLETTISSYGAGLRWQVTKDKKLNLGIDVGFSDDNSAIYVQVGEKF